MLTSKTESSQMDTKEIKIPVTMWFAKPISLESLNLDKLMRIRNMYDAASIGRYLETGIAEGIYHYSDYCALSHKPLTLLIRNMQNFSASLNSITEHACRGMGYIGLKTCRFLYNNTGGNPIIEDADHTNVLLYVMEGALKITTIDGETWVRAGSVANIPKGAKYRIDSAEGFAALRFAGAPFLDELYDLKVAPLKRSRFY